MRGNANTSAGAKTALKILQENFSDLVHQVLIIKPDNFWQKQRSSIASNKYKFEVTTISIQAIGKIVDMSQLTSDFDGFFHYDHSQWLDLRLSYEDFSWQANDIADRIEDFQEDLQHFDLAEEVNGAKHQIDNHGDMKRKIVKLPLDDLEGQGQKLLGKLAQYMNRLDGTSAAHSNASSTDASPNSPNPDINDTINQILQHLESSRSAQQQLLSLWQQKKTRLDQCFQLRLFEQDCEKMFEWIMHNRDVFQQNYMDIGVNHITAKNLQEDHNRFAVTTMTVSVNIGRILNVAGRLVETNHYASQHIRTLASRLDKTWKEFTNRLDERTAVLNLSVIFHHKAEQYAESVLSWSAAVEASIPNPSDAENLETAIRTHQSLYEAMCHAYTEVHSTSKKLLYQLDHLVQVCNQPTANNNNNNSSGKVR
jgi:triple functional domain protein